MLDYYLFLAITMIFAATYDKTPQKKNWYFATLTVMVLFAGLRSSEVGTDAAGYARKFISENRQVNGDLGDQANQEVGFYYLSKYLRLISHQYWVLFTGIALLTYTCVLRAIRSETDKLLIPLFVFITLGFYTFVFNAARQGIAVAIYMLAFKYLFVDSKKGFIRYCIFVFLAAMFHRTAIIALPLYFVFRLKFSPKMIMLNILIGVLVAFALPTLFAYAGDINQRYLFYMNEKGGGELLTLFYVLITAFFIIWRKKIDERFKRRYDIFLNMMIFGSMIYVFVQIAGVYIELTRFAAYFQVAAIFLWTFIYQSEDRPSYGFSVVMVLGHLVYFFIFCNQMASLVPYKFNPEII